MKISEFVDRLKSNLEADGEKQAVSLAWVPLATHNVEPYTVWGYDGTFLLTFDNMLRLEEKGYLVEGDVLYHPQYWEPGSTFHGFDGAVDPKHELATKWLKDRYLI